MNANPKCVILKNHLSPGDVLCMTTAIHALHQQYRGDFKTAVDTTAQELFEHNPNIQDLGMAREQGWEEATMHYPAIGRSNQEPVHVLHGYREFLEQYFQIRLPFIPNRPVLHLSVQEKEWMSQVEQVTKRKQRFWIVNAGVKQDFTAKQWPWYQQVVDRLQGQIVFAQVGCSEHLQSKLKGVIDLVDKTSHRELVRLVWHSDGVLCGTTYLMHLAAAWEKPAVVIAGGREPRLWNSYPKQTLFSTVGMLPCCKDAACWKSRTVPLHDHGMPWNPAHEKDKDLSVCEYPVMTEPVAPKCMAMISPEEVCQAILRYQA